MKKILYIIPLILLVLNSCKKSEIIPNIKPINFGIKSTNMNFNSIITQLNNTVSFNVIVTPGAKYLFQIINFKGEVIKTQGLEATQQNEYIKINLDKIPEGVYDLIFIDIQGNEIKQPLIIK
jgi:hypothetical protein